MAYYCSTHGDHSDHRCPKCLEGGVAMPPDLQDVLDEAKKQTLLLERILGKLTAIASRT